MSADVRRLEPRSLRRRSHSARECKIGVGACGPTAPTAPLQQVTRQAEDAVRRIARLLGRQIAREQFKRRQDSLAYSPDKQETSSDQAACTGFPCSLRSLGP